MNREQFKAAWRYARLNRWRGGQSIGGLFFRPQLAIILRDENAPRPFYWKVSTQQHASTSDRLFYVARARGIRRSGFKTIHPDLAKALARFCK